MSNLVVAPVVIPLFTGALLFFSPRRLAWQRWVSAISLSAALVVNLLLMRYVWTEGIQPFYAGNLPAPFGITFVADLMSIAFVTVTSVTALAVLFFSIYSLDESVEKGHYYAAFQFLLVGVNGSFLTGDIFNLFVFFEVMLLASYLLISLGGRRLQLQETLKYALINNVASGFFLLAVAGLYRTYGTLNMADLALRTSAAGSNGWLSAIGILFLVVFGVKAAMVPLHFWLPQPYFAGPTAIVAFFGGILSKVGVYTILRTFTLIFVEETAWTHGRVLLPLALLTMVVGIVGAIAQTDFKKILAFHIVSQIGYMLMGIAFLTPLAIAGTIIFVVHQMIVKSGLFLCAGAAERISGTTDLKEMSGLMTTHGGFAALFFVSALALVGVPPLSGFFGKLTLIRAGLEAQHFFSVAVAIVVGLGTLFSMIKIFRLSFWGEVRGERRLPRQSQEYKRMMIPVGALVVLALAIGLGVEHVFTYAQAAAEQLLDRQAYVGAVLPGLDVDLGL